MSAIWFPAVLMMAAALVFFAVPLWQQRCATGRWPLAGIAAAVATVPIAFALYLQVSNWTPRAADASAARRMASGLAARLAQVPDDVGGWQRLGRTYRALGEAVKARDAYREAWARTSEPDSTLTIALAEAEVLADRAALGGEAGRLFEQVLATEPDNLKALWYGGLAAAADGREALAKSRWSRLLELDPPLEIRERLARQWGLVADAAARGAAAPARPGSAAATAITLEVRLGASVPRQPGSTLFVFARAPGGGPPVAVIRKPGAELPGTFTLRDSDSMIPGRSLADFPALTVVARLSATGEPTERPGDFYARAEAAPGSTVELVVDTPVP